MFIITTIVYCLFVLVVVYPPDELLAAGLTLRHLLDGYLPSENVNFVEYHMKRIGWMVFIQSLLAPGYMLALWACGVESVWLPCLTALTALCPGIASFVLLNWNNFDMKKHPLAQTLAQYANEGRTWREAAANVNAEFREVDKVIVPLTSTSWLIATNSWMIKVSQYRVDLIKQDDCSMVATTMDIYSGLAPHEEIQHLSVDCQSTRAGVPGFKFRVSTAELQQLNARLARPVGLPPDLQVLPTLVERFLVVFLEIITENPVFYVDEEPELCIGCMSAPADVKLNKRCESRAQPPCQPCGCKPQWCASCLARWWAARAPAADWLTSAGSCPLCRAVFCLRDVSRVQRTPA